MTERQIKNNYAEPKEINKVNFIYIVIFKTLRHNL